MSFSALRAVHLGACFALAVLTGCGSSSQPLPTQKDDLNADVVAKVGEASIALGTVERIAHERGIDPRSALELAISDAVFAEHGKRELSAMGLVSYLDRLALARALLGQLKVEATERGPVSDEEITAIVSDRWWEFEHPDLFRTTHAIVMTKGPEEDAAALALAQKIRAAVEGVTDPKEFKTRVDAIDAAPLKKKVESLPPVARDGRAVDPKNPPPSGPPASSFDRVFTEAASDLKRVGQLSPVVHSKFGYHVLLLTEIVPAKNVPFEERRLLLHDEALRRRAESSYQKLLETLWAKASITFATGAQALMASTQKQP